MMDGKKKNGNEDVLIYIILAALMILGWHFASGTAFNSGDAKFPVNFNLFLYVTSITGVCIAATVLFFVSDSVTAHIGESSGLSRFFNVVLMPVFVLTAAAVILLIYKTYDNENTLFPGEAAGYSLRQYFPHPFYFAFFLIPAAAIFIGVSGKGDIKRSVLIRTAAALAVSLLSALYNWCPNPFADDGGGILHIDAYTTTIINTARMVPFDSHHISIYGHHGILYLPVIRIFGNNYRALLAAIAFFTFITFMAACYVADVLIEKDFIYILTVSVICATTTLLTRRGVYYQINPHRIMFPILSLALVAWEARHPGAKLPFIRLIIKFFVCVLAFVWNFETGFFTTAVLAVTVFVSYLYDTSWFTLRAVRTVLLLAVFAVGSFFAAVGAVDLYNLAAGGGPVSLRQFVYPLFSGVYNVNNLRMMIPSVGHLYFLQILLFGFTVLAVLRGRKDDPAEVRGVKILSAATALSGLASLIYLINRPAYGNMSIAFVQMALLLGHVADLFSDRKKMFSDGIKAHRLFKYSLSLVLFFVLFWISTEGILYIDQGLSIRRISGWDTASETETLNRIREEIPEDTFAIGKGIPQLYYELGWDPQIYPIDIPDINDENRQYIKERIDGESAVFTSKADIVPETFQLKSSYTLGTVEFGYYVLSEAA